MYWEFAGLADTCYWSRDATASLDLTFNPGAIPFAIAALVFAFHTRMALPDSRRVTPGAPGSLVGMNLSTDREGTL